MKLRPYSHFVLTPVPMQSATNKAAPLQTLRSFLCSYFSWRLWSGWSISMTWCNKWNRFAYGAIFPNLFLMLALQLISNNPSELALGTENEEFVKNWNKTNNDVRTIRDMILMTLSEWTEQFKSHVETNYFTIHVRKENLSMTTRESITLTNQKMPRGNFSRQSRSEKKLINVSGYKITHA